jgi:molybdate transport system regulatory protein
MNPSFLLKPQQEGIIMKVSARNSLKGTVKSIEIGAVNAEVVIELADGHAVTSIVTKESIKTLGLVKGGTAYAIIKASNIMLGVDD